MTSRIDAGGEGREDGPRGRDSGRHESIIMSDAAMTIENETWLINEGDRIINKKSSDGPNSLTDLEKAIYCLWVVDYAVRNSGSLEPMRELNRNSISELLQFSKNNKCHHLYSMLELAKDEKAFCVNYYKEFDNACKDLRYFYTNGK